MRDRQYYSPGMGVQIHVESVREKIESTSMYQELGLGFLPIRKLIEQPGEYADDIVVLMGSGSALPIHIHPKAHHAETWDVLCGNGIAYTGKITKRLLSDEDLVERWNTSEDTNIVDGVLEVSAVFPLFPGKRVHIKAGDAHGCDNSNQEPLMFYASLEQKDGSHGRDPSDRRLRCIPAKVSMASLRKCLDPVSQRLFSLC